jgi:hypothetical protein
MANKATVIAMRIEKQTIKQGYILSPPELLQILASLTFLALPKEA